MPQLMASKGARWQSHTPEYLPRCLTIESPRGTASPLSLSIFYYMIECVYYIYQVLVLGGTLLFNLLFNLG